jgi:DNA-binding transcriptional ArsR family regulator
MSASRDVRTLEQQIVHAGQAYLAKLGWPVEPLYEPPEGTPPEKTIKGMQRRKGWVPPTDPEELPHQFVADNRRLKGLGLQCGSRSRVFVVDVDPRNGGSASFERLEKQHGPCPRTPKVQTGGGGFHLYFEYPHRGRLRANLGEEYPGIDILSGRKLAILPPSPYPGNGLAYEWITTPAEVPVAGAPEWLLNLVTRKANQPQDGKKRTHGIWIPKGCRNTTLTSFAGSLRRVGANSEEIAAALKVRNANRCDHVLDENEVDRIAESIGRYPTGDGEHQDYTNNPESQIISTTDRPWEVPSGEIEPVSFVDLGGEPRPPNWLWPGYIAHGEIGHLCGDSGTGKTGMAVGLCHAIAKCQPYLGITPTTSGPVLFCDEEMGTDEIRRYFQRYGEPHENLFVTSTEGLDLMSPMAMARLEKTIKEVNPIFTVFDSLREFIGADSSEDDSGDAAEFYHRLRWLVKRYSFSPMILSHLVKRRRDQSWGKHLLRGSGHHVAAAAYVLAIRRDLSNDNICEIHQWKRRGRILPTLVYEYDDGGGEATAISLRARETAETSTTPVSAVHRMGESILELLRDRGPTGRAGLLPLHVKCKVSVSTLDRALRKYRESGQIKRESEKNGRFYHPGQEGIL